MLPSCSKACKPQYGRKTADPAVTRRPIGEFRAMRQYRFPRTASIDDLTLAEIETPAPGRGQALAGCARRR